MAKQTRPSLTMPVLFALIVAGITAHFASVEQMDDPALTRLVSADLEGNARNRLIKAQDIGGRSTDGSVERRFASTQVEIREMRGSAPLLNLGGANDQVLEVRYIVHDSEGGFSETLRRYRAYRNEADDGWHLGSEEPGPLAFYLNFI